MEPLISNYIDSHDFSRVGFKIILKNETSQTTFLNSDLIFIKELKDNGVIIDCPTSLFQKGHSLSLFFFDADYEFPQKASFLSLINESKFQIICKVESLMSYETNQEVCSANLIFTQYDVKNWKQILTACQDNQDQINNILDRQHSRVTEDD